MIDLYTFNTSNGQRASIGLEEAGLPYRAHKIDLAKGEQKNPEFLKINPAGRIPALVDSDGPDGKPLMLAQSGAILLYAADKSGRLMPQDNGCLQSHRVLIPKDTFPLVVAYVRCHKESSETG